MNKDNLFILFLIFALLSCVDKEENTPGTFFLKLEAPELKQFESLRGRMANNALWEQIYEESIQIQFKNKNDGSLYFLEISPLDFSKEYEIKLPLGDYEYAYVSESESFFQKYLPIRINGEFSMNSFLRSQTMKTTTEFSLLVIDSKYILNAWFFSESSPSDRFEAFRTGSENLFYGYVRDNNPFFLALRIDGLDSLTVIRIEDLQSTFLLLSNDDFEGDLSFLDLVIDPFGYEEGEITIGAGENMLSSKLEKTVWVGDENYRSCDCGFSGIIGFKGGRIYELSEFGSKEPTGCFPYNFLFRDYNGRIENFSQTENKISFNNVMDAWTEAIEIELINEKLKIKSTSVLTIGTLSWIQEFNPSDMQFEGFCD